MLLIPAIDLKNGQCVRLRQGNLSDSTIFSEEPSIVAKRWLESGARRIHLVDLNGAFIGKPKNDLQIKSILDTIDNEIPVQIGGGIRDLNTIEYYLDIGISYVIIGTEAVKNPGFLNEACVAFPGHIIAGLDAKDGKLATDGWSKITKHNLIDIAKKFENYGCDSIIYTDINRDGMLSGLNIESTVELARNIKIPVYASGGVATIKDIEKLCEVSEEGIEGAILGRSIYEGSLDFRSAQKLADELTKPKSK
ncbi:phosphoribosylformimino-5-aminoimidazole carboxamide ribonucleotide isomerase HisA [Candidatus Kinetoplastibacterium blastocrithidii TCC012E]|uniref:1-(5-phosphoribosyl)-5-[(5-phosphoribosylamino)methylideneamino] imidazole-4-carboxamide isomerase n=1 Tax=Candidatus Kinetoplastidibacterium blastocrithidiae TCC012E TaxID=1208922 RepID=M1LV95_9PROT|nr:1-(5-phosphoribosyl)-5-[(5-phosphoribosylamino)methylideneamino]imidazole-4-carboxamide isomerase [Candidatus Kinetoplastibacterium blastocrithidii]AFZ83374.1 phosphoribosylformimino-5-aminoimidazole carboxamide ribotide isomerase [Candidatus Kinetoplastibacterium blastocrithidii (ex Strigomonas culicis)]AGF49472.1 phosphoribosylformimino-5-aminoimidazole carboxamide ribonucleotide isomerase HisA [Candidatus Kinetoplastibacterium blastocrithidii TCC012E]